MSKVWRARDSMTGQIVALKVLDLVKTKRLEARFVGLKRPSEGEVAVTLKHPNIVKTMEFGYTTKNEQFLVMEYIEGMGLSYLIDAQNQVMKENRLKFMIELAAAIEFFHKQNWIHRDICPRNILVDNEHRIKLIDFGLVVPNTETFQKPGNRTGTANYMAPELIKRQKTDQRIDIFSYSVTCYEMWAKRLPWEAAESFEAVMQHINAPPDPITEHAPEIDPEIAEVIMKGLAVHPADRWQTMTEIADKLRDIQKRLLADSSKVPKETVE